jgi:hypothetical protein
MVCTNCSETLTNPRRGRKLPNAPLWEEIVPPIDPQAFEDHYSAGSPADRVRAFGWRNGNDKTKIQVVN